MISSTNLDNYECNVIIPSLDTVIYMQEGDGSQMDAIDYANGYEGYVDYDILSGKNSGDGGIFMYKESEADNWKDMIPSVICFALDQESCPEYKLEQAARY